jgi:membrane-associated protein
MTLEPIVDFFVYLVSLGKPENLQKLVNLGGPEWVSYVILFAIVFSETGLLVGFFLPGDSLLFAAGFLASSGVFDLLALNITLIVAAIVGDAANYLLGLQMTERVFERGKLRFVKHEHLLAAKVFYERYGNMAIVLARFVPLVRTFTPFVAGVARMRYDRFVVYNVIGGAAWVMSMTFAGYWLGQFELIRAHFELVVVLIIGISFLPVVIGLWKRWLAQRAFRKEMQAEQP